MIVVHVSHAAYLRGYTVPGEICEIEGAGPITVPTAYRLASDSIMKTVVTNGVDITLISHPLDSPEVPANDDTKRGLTLSTERVSTSR